MLLQIIIGGDSAGGNLALGLLSLLLHPHPSITTTLQTPVQSLKGVLLVSPWVNFDQSASSFTINRLKDNLTSRGLRKWSDAYMGSAQPDNFNTPLNAPADWWRNLPADGVLVLGDKMSSLSTTSAKSPVI